MNRLEKINQFLNDENFLRKAKPEVIEKFRNEKEYLEKLNIPMTGKVVDLEWIRVDSTKDINTIHYRLTKTNMEGIELLELFEV